MKFQDCHFKAMILEIKFRVGGLKPTLDGFIGCDKGLKQYKIEESVINSEALIPVLPLGDPQKEKAFHTPTTTLKTNPPVDILPKAGQELEKVFQEPIKSKVETRVRATFRVLLLLFSGNYYKRIAAIYFLCRTILRRLKPRQACSKVIALCATSFGETNQINRPGISVLILNAINKLFTILPIHHK